MSDKTPRYSRILLKLSGEALAGTKDMGIDTEVLDKMSLSIAHFVVKTKKKLKKLLQEIMFSFVMSVLS